MNQSIYYSNKDNCNDKINNKFDCKKKCSTFIFGATGPTGPTGDAGVLNYADFYALMPPDNAATVAPGTDVSFPQDGPNSSVDI